MPTEPKTEAEAHKLREDALAKLEDARLTPHGKHCFRLGFDACMAIMAESVIRLTEMREVIQRQRRMTPEECEQFSAFVEKELEPRIPTPAVGDGWQPIETAPKDGTRVLFYDPDSSGLIYVGVWDAKFCSEWPEGAEEAVYRGAWTDYAVASFAYEEHCEYSPTHWQPLPAPTAHRPHPTGGQVMKTDSNSWQPVPDERCEYYHAEVDPPVWVPVIVRNIWTPRFGSLEYEVEGYLPGQGTRCFRVQLGRIRKTVVEPILEELRAICESHAEPVTEYLRTNGRIRPTEDWRAMAPDFRARVLRNPAGFLKMALARKEIIQ